MQSWNSILAEGVKFFNHTMTDKWRYVSLTLLKLKENLLNPNWMILYSHSFWSKLNMYLTTVGRNLRSLHEKGKATHWFRKKMCFNTLKKLVIQAAIKSDIFVLLIEWSYEFRVLLLFAYTHVLNFGICIKNTLIEIA